MTTLQNLSLKLKIQLIILGSIAALTIVGLSSFFSSPAPTRKSSARPYPLP